MAPDWVCPLGSVADVYDGPHATPKKTRIGPVFLGIASLNRGHLDLSQSQHVSEDDFVRWTKRVRPEPGDVVFSYETRLGEAAIIPTNLRCCLGRRMGLLRPKRNRILPEYLLYAYLSPAFQAVIQARTIHGSTVDRISIKEIGSFPIQVPPLPVQRQIVNQLRTIDLAIEENYRLNQTLENIAQTIFQAWFVDFLPVRSKLRARAEGCDPLRAAMSAMSGKADAELDELSREQYEQLAATAALFPDELVDSELGEVPRGWDDTTWGELVTLEYGKSLRDYSKDTGTYPVYGTNGQIGFHSESLCPYPGIVVGRKGAYRGVHYSSTPFFVIDTAYYVCPRSDIDLRWAYYQLLRHDINSIDSGSAIPSTSRPDFYALRTICPPRQIQDAFLSLVAPGWEMQEHNARENVTLIELRDMLLPKLLTGELAVPMPDPAA